PVDADGLVLVAEHGAREAAGNRVERVDPPVAEVADEEIAAEGTEARWRLGQAPWGIQETTRSQSLHEQPVRREDVDEPATGTGHVIVLRGVLQGVGHVEQAVDLLDPEWRVARRHEGIVEVAE